MKILVVVVVFACLSRGNGAGTSETKTKSTTKHSNSIPLPQKAEQYQQHEQQQMDFLPMHYIQKPIFQAAQQPHAMIIIAQPAYVPQHLVYNNHNANAAQQLLNYFHSNPQARYQFLYGTQPTAQPFIAQAHPAHSQTIATYQVVPSPAYHPQQFVAAAPSHLNYMHSTPLQMTVPQFSGNYATQQHQPLQLGHISQMAQQYSTPFRSVPPIVTGFENFTPEQQAQIKSQLSAHLGTPITVTPASHASAQGQTNTSQYGQPPQSLNTHEFMASPQEKSASQTASSSPALVYRSQFTKG